MLRTIHLFALYIDDLGKLCNSQIGCFIILYADDILLISPSVVYLEQLLHACERELKWLDMSINLNKSCCLRIGPRSNIICADVTSLTGHKLPWVSEMRYLMYILCSLDHSSALWIMPNADFTAQQIAYLVRLDELHLRK